MLKCDMLLNKRTSQIKASYLAGTELNIVVGVKFWCRIDLVKRNIYQNLPFGLTLKDCLTRWSLIVASGNVRTEVCTDMFWRYFYELIRCWQMRPELYPICVILRQNMKCCFVYIYLRITTTFLTIFKLRIRVDRLMDLCTSLRMKCTYKLLCYFAIYVCQKAAEMSIVFRLGWLPVWPQLK